ncbi:MAG: hypothetical protein H6Q65_130 [Firmicutes bacterium]|nr:hypothetical protein [Bacillota bacterium]
MTTEQLWQEYAFLTREMIKFVTKRDFSLVNTLLEQREKLQEMISASGDKTYRGSPDGRALLTSIMAQEQQIAAALQLLRNKMQQQQTVSGAYEAFRSGPNIGWMKNISV